MTTRMRRGRSWSAWAAGAALGLSALSAAAQNEPAPALEADAAALSCGAVVVAEFEWPAAEIAAHIMERALRDGYNCLAVRRRADPDRALTAIVNAADQDAASSVGARLIAPGVRIPATGQEQAAPGVGLGAALYGAGDVEGLFIPAWLAAENRELRLLADLPAFGRKMAAEGVRPTLRLCPETWPCAEEAQAVAAQLRLAQWFNVETPASGAALITSLQAERRAAIAARAPWISYFWAPSQWAAEARLWPLRPGETAYCPEIDDCRQAFVRPPQRVIYAPALVAKTPRLSDFLNNFQIPAQAMTEALSWRALSKADAPSTAARLIENNQPLLEQWFDATALAAFQQASQAPVRAAAAVRAYRYGELNGLVRDRLSRFTAKRRVIAFGQSDCFRGWR